jgi:hypothetical protein
VKKLSVQEENSSRTRGGGVERLAGEWGDVVEQGKAEGDERDPSNVQSRNGAGRDAL